MQILQVEEFIHGLRPGEGVPLHHVVRQFPELLGASGLVLHHWEEEDDDLDFWMEGFALPAKGGGWSLYAGSGVQRMTFTPAQGGGTKVEYEGPFNGLGESPYTPDLDLQEVMTGKVVASGYKGSMKGYLAHRAKTLVHFAKDVWSGPSLRGAGLPGPFFNEGWSLWAYQEKAPVEGFENVSPEWAGTPVKLAFLANKPQAELAWDSRGYYQPKGWEKTPEWVKRTIPVR